MPTDRKIQLVNEMKEMLSSYVIAIGTDYRGLSANDMNQLRKELTEKGIDYKVVKNNLAKIAADEVGDTEFHRLLQETTGVAFSSGDPVEPAKLLVEFAKTHRVPLEIRSAILEGVYLSGDQVVRLVDLPSKEVLIAQLLAQLNSPVARLVTVLQGPIAKLPRVLNNPIQGLTTVLSQRVKQMS